MKTFVKITLKAIILQSIEYVVEAEMDNGKSIVIRDTNEDAAIEAAIDLVTIDTEQHKSSVNGYTFEIYNTHNKLVSSTFEQIIF